MIFGEDMMREFIFGLFVALFLAVVISQFASPWPDGLERVAGDKGFIEKSEVTLFNSPIPDYSWPGIKNEKVSTSVAGMSGTIIVFLLSLGLGYLLKKGK